jgi:hypothetical protein
MCDIMVIGLLYGLTLWPACVWGGFGSNDFVTKMQPFLMDNHHRTDIISNVGYLRLKSVVPLVLRMVCCAMTGHCHCIIGPSGQRQP